MPGQNHFHVALSKPQIQTYKQLGKQGNTDGFQMSWDNLLLKILLTDKYFPPSNPSLLVGKIFCD